MRRCGRWGCRRLEKAYGFVHMPARASRTLEACVPSTKDAKEHDEQRSSSAWRHFGMMITNIHKGREGTRRAALLLGLASFWHDDYQHPQRTRRNTTSSAPPFSRSVGKGGRGMRGKDVGVRKTRSTSGKLYLIIFSPSADVAFCVRKTRSTSGKLYPCEISPGEAFTCGEHGRTAPLARASAHSTAAVP